MTPSTVEGIPHVSVTDGVASLGVPDPLRCVDCGAELRPKTFSNGEWSVDELAKHGRELAGDGNVYCYTHFKIRIDARKSATAPAKGGKA